MGNRHSSRSQVDWAAASLSGVIAAIVTPFTSDDQVDGQALAEQTERLVRAGVGGIATCGSTGEFTSMTTHERKLVTETVLRTADRRVPVVAQTGSTRFNEAIDLTIHASNLGAAAVMVVPPFYEPLSWAEVTNYYRLLAKSAAVPIVLYHIPGATGQKLTIDQIDELARIDGIRFMKDSSADVDLLRELIRRFSDHPNFSVFNGWDSLNYSALVEGARGTIWGMANFIPELCVEFYTAVAIRHQIEAGRQVWSRILPLVQFCESHSYVSAVKAACDLVGNPLGQPRLPLLPISLEDRRELRKLLESAGVTARVVSA